MTGIKYLPLIPGSNFRHFHLAHKTTDQITQQLGRKDKVNNIINAGVELTERRVILSNSSFWDVTVPRAMSIYANVIFAVLWIGFFIALIVDRTWLDALWNWVQALPFVPRIMVWLIILPIMVGLWIWESSWSTFGQLLGYTGIVAWTLLALSSLIKAFR